MLRAADTVRAPIKRTRNAAIQPLRPSGLLTGLSKPSPALGCWQCDTNSLRQLSARQASCNGSPKPLLQDLQARAVIARRNGTVSAAQNIGSQALCHCSCLDEAQQPPAAEANGHHVMQYSVHVDDIDSRWRTVAELLQQVARLAAVSVLIASICFTMPAAAVAQQHMQLEVQQVQQLPSQHHSMSTFGTNGSRNWLRLRQQEQQTAMLQTQEGSSTLVSSNAPPATGSQSDTAATALRGLVTAATDTNQQQPEHLLFTLSSQVEDGMLEAVRQLEAGFDRAFGAVGNSLHMIDAAHASSEQAATDAAAQALIMEVWEVVDTSYMDARNSGFDHDKWLQLRDAALARTYYDQASVHRAVRDMLAQGVSDPYCRFIPPGEFQSMKKYDVTGVGLNLGTAEEYIKKTGRNLPKGSSTDGGVWVVGLSKGSEADRAGVEQGDQLLWVADVELSTVTPFQAATLIAGPDDSSTDSPVTLRVQKADGRVLDVTVQRPARYLPSPVSSNLQQRGDGRTVGIIRLTSFNARALRDVTAALEDLQQRGATEIVLDLRDNRGGLVSEGLEVARLFLSDQVPIVLTQSKAMAADPPRASSIASSKLPLTVLVNEHTASASEILAGALKDNCRGVLVGKRTYGKGLIQSVYELSDSSGLIITVGKYLTPRGVDIDRFGIAPNFVTLPGPDQAADAINACRLEAGMTPRPVNGATSVS